ncbi:MAG TPA: 30S ribosomal protein S1 [Solirubrobacterales bacterium]|nr:30S ribosomal protein S1 [Solirubrobacterales bacterium]
MSATETMTPAPTATPVDGSGGLLLQIDGKIVPNYAATMVSFEEGDVVNGKVVRIDKDEVLVDIGYKAEGVIPSGELSIRKSVDPHEEVELGEEVDALVLTKEDAEGRLILSKKRARFEKAWRRIEVAADSGEPVEGGVIEVVKGGLILDLGVRGFLPASLVDIRRVHNLDEFMGQTLECKVIELNRSRNNVVLSRRAVLEEERKEVREQILGRLEPGQVVEGKISNIVDFGAFVDLEGIDGLIHISELSWSHVNHPSEVVAIGDTVRIKVLDIDRDRQRISLGLKQTQEDPWQRVISTHRPGDVLEGAVTKVVAFGAFVEILPGVEGLVHISELADHHVENPSEVVEPGSKLNVKILEIDEERRRLSLSIKRVEGQNMPMQDLGAQLQEASGAAPAGPVADEDSSSSQAAGEDPSSAPPAEEASEAEGSDAPEAAEVEGSAEEVPAAEGSDAEAEAPAEEAAVAEAEAPAEEAAVAEEDGTAEGSDAPADPDETIADEAQTGESEQG